ncbi:Eif2s2 [Symbiodinium sp. CCMP2456]|nr:Eif2s2 [Symbiodinium sp. CCMP2456]
MGVVWAEEEQVFDFGSKKKKKTKDKKEKADKDEGAKEEGEVKLQGVEGWTQGELHPYKDLLERLYKIIEEHNPEVGNKERYILKPPQVVRVGSKKVAWVNFSEICSMMKRPVDHVVQFVLAEFGTEGSVAGSATTRAEGQGQDGQLVLKGRYQPKHCESLLRKYIKEYVTCEMCKSASTTLRKDPSTRLTMVECSKCGATRTAASIKAGFHAVTRGDRKAAKQLK